MATEQVAPNQEYVAELRKVVRALASLPQDQQRVMLLVVVWELSYSEAAANLGIPIGTVMSRLARGRERMRELLPGGNSRDREQLRHAEDADTSEQIGPTRSPSGAPAAAASARPGCRGGGGCRAAI